MCHHMHGCLLCWGVIEFQFSNINFVDVLTKPQSRQVNKILERIDECGVTAWHPIGGLSG